jgi:sporulation integral membrane protein YtvI
MLSAFFISMDHHIIRSFISYQVPEEWIEKLKTIFNDLTFALIGYIKAQAILITITFTELFIAFNLIGIRFSLVLAIIVSIVDALPILGTGTVLIPWAVISALTGHFNTAIYLVITYAVILSVRQMIEPKLVSFQIGIHPLLTLLAMYTGFGIIGCWGLLLGPITLVILKNVLAQLLAKGIFKDLVKENNIK